jgi:hypothetical protein
MIPSLPRVLRTAFAVCVSALNVTRGADSNRAEVERREVEAGAQANVPRPVRYHFQRGDDPVWAARDFDESAWPVVSGRELPSRDGIYWMRFRVTQRTDWPLSPRDGLLFKVVASYDLYWDGRLIGRNGRVSTIAEDEGPGSVDALFQVPSDLVGPGEHVVAMRD